MGKVGRKPVLTVIEEDVFTTGVEHICSWGFPLDMLDPILLLIKRYLTKRQRTVPYFNNTLVEHGALVFVKRNNLTNCLLTNIKVLKYLKKVCKSTS